MVSDDDYFTLKLALLTEKVDEETVAMLKEINFEELSDQMDIVIEMVRSIQRNNFIDKPMAEKLFRIFLNGCRKYINEDSDINFKIIPYMICCLECVNYFRDTRIVIDLELENVFSKYINSNLSNLHIMRKVTVDVSSPIISLINQIMRAPIEFENRMTIATKVLGITPAVFILFNEIKELKDFFIWCTNP